MKKTVKSKFTPIEIKEFAKTVVKNNPSENKANIITEITNTFEEVKKGERCKCGIKMSCFVFQSCSTSILTAKFSILRAQERITCCFIARPNGLMAGRALSFRSDLVDLIEQDHKA